MNGTAWASGPGKKPHAARRIALAVAVLVGSGLLFVAPQVAQAAKPAPACSILVTGDGTASATISATFVDVPHGGSTTFTIDGTTVSNPTTVETAGDHEASCAVLNKKGVVIAGSTVTFAVAPAIDCTFSATAVDATHVHLVWTTVPNGDFFYAVQVDSSVVEDGTVTGGPDPFTGPHSVDDVATVLTSSATYTMTAYGVDAEGTRTGEMYCTIVQTIA